MGRARRANLEPVALVAPCEGARPLADGLPRRVLFLLGAEGAGLPAAETADCAQVCIPAGDLKAAADSLNVGVAAAIAAYAWRERWRDA